jgi:hypothetical protein
VQLTVMGTAERDGELVADLLSEPARLGKAQVMRIAWLPAADQAWLFDDEAQVLPIALPRYLWQEDEGPVALA